MLKDEIQVNHAILIRLARMEFITNDVGLLKPLTLFQTMIFLLFAPSIGHFLEEKKKMRMNMKQ